MTLIKFIPQKIEKLFAIFIIMTNEIKMWQIVWPTSPLRFRSVRGDVSFSGIFGDSGERGQGGTNVGPWSRQLNQSSFRKAESPTSPLGQNSLPKGVPWWCANQFHIVHPIFRELFFYVPEMKDRLSFMGHEEDERSAFEGWNGCACPE